MSKTPTVVHSTASPRTLTEQRVLVHAPIGRDGPLTLKILTERGIPAHLCEGLEEFCQEIRCGAGAVIVTMEALLGDGAERLAAALEHQPPWSDLPVLVLTSHGEREEVLHFLSHVTILEKPLRLPSLLSAVRTAIQARERQYQVRDLLEQAEQARAEAERQQAHIAALNAQLQRAMTETHHRVKNNLQVISAMIDLQVLEGKSVVSIEEMRRLAAHVRTLAAVHDILTKQARQDEQATHVSARAILSRLIELMQQTTYGRQIRLAADDLRISTRQSTSLAIILNELISNAIKHGEGDIEVRLSADKGYLILEVRDHGPGFPPGFDARQQASTGLDLIDHLARWDLRGEVRYTTHPEGGALVTISTPQEG
ncbi:MAG TPA: ATP-binding protein [Chthonomonadaceae bacterium]|nr:ATP-binding protein [Chthonomonadaceae bacterium]